MNLELCLLAWSVVLLALHIAAQSGLAAPIKGAAWNVGPRDEGRPPLGKYAGRAQRALDNFKETYPAFIALAVVLSLTGKTDGNGALGAELWFGVRIVYLPLYLAGVPYLRTAAYGVSLVGLVMMFLRVL